MAVTLSVCTVSQRADDDSVMELCKQLSQQQKVTSILGCDTIESRAGAHRGMYTTSRDLSATWFVLHEFS